MQELSIIKIGGNIIDDEALLADLLRKCAVLPGHNILVHGGGKIASRTGLKLGIEPCYVEGRRVTDSATLELVTMVYGGLVNKQIVAGLQAAGCNAIGLTGADGALLRAQKRPVGNTDYGFVGDLSDAGVNTALLQALLLAGLTAVLAPLSYDGAGGLLNTNADTIAQSVAVAMAGLYRVQLVYCFEQAGVLRDAADAASVIRDIDAGSFATLQEGGIITGGMIPKVQNALTAVAAGVHSVSIGKAADLHELLRGTKGTLIR